MPAFLLLAELLVFLTLDCTGYPCSSAIFSSELHRSPMQHTRLYILSFLLAIAGYCSVFCQDTTATILIKQRTFTPVQTITGDTLSADTLVRNPLVLPGPGERFSALQDSAYFRMLRLGIPAGTLAQLHAKIIGQGFRIMQEQAKQNPFEIALMNLNLPAEYYAPRPQEIVQRQEMISRAQAIPTGRPSSIGAGVQVPLSAIAAFFGMGEDVSPVITYSVDYSMPVKIVIYSTAAREIAVLLDNKQSPGKYQITWNGRDDKGRPMPSGDYVAEVRLGNDRIQRKRINIP
jgi:hypothetical protein